MSSKYFINKINLNQSQHIRRRLEQAHGCTSHSNIPRAHFSNILNVSLEKMALRKEHTQLTWFHFHTVGTVYLNSGKSFSGKRGQWRKGQRRKCEGLEGWRKNYSPCTCVGMTGECWVQKIQQICLKMYMLAKSSFTKKKHRNRFFLLSHSVCECCELELPQNLRTGACSPILRATLTLLPFTRCMS